MPPTLGELMKSHRTRPGSKITQAGLGERLGVPQATISRWEKNENGPEDQFIPAIAAWLGADEPTVIAARYEGARQRREGGGKSDLVRCYEQLDEALVRIRTLEAELRRHVKQ